MKELELAEFIICLYLERTLSPVNLNELYEIRHDNKLVLKEHLEALNNIFTKALKQLDGEMNK